MIINTHLKTIAAGFTLLWASTGLMAQNWNIPSNGTAASSGHLGTGGTGTAAIPLKIATNNTASNIQFFTGLNTSNAPINNRLTILGSNGNVGVNVDNPLEKLHVNGHTTIQGGSLLVNMTSSTFPQNTGEKFQIAMKGGFYNNYLGFVFNNGGFIGVHQPVSQDRIEFYSREVDNGPQRFGNLVIYKNGNLTMGNSGNVIVGGEIAGSSFQEKLEVNGSAKVMNKLGINTNKFRAPQAFLHVDDFDNSITDKLLMVGDDSYFADIDKTGALSLQSCSTNTEAYFQLGNGGMTLYGNPTKLEIGKYDATGNFQRNFTLGSNGTLGVNCSSVPTGFIAAFNGKIRARGLKCDQTAWCDDVFNEKYKLMTMDSLSMYIKQHKHLPEVPTSETVLKEGVDIAEINEKFLRKIEENTLYILELKRENDLLKEEIKLIKAKLER